MLPSYFPSRWLPGGHFQTLATFRRQTLPTLRSTPHVVSLCDGDAIVLHEDAPVLDSAVRRSCGEDAVLLVHGLCGCHAAGYMIRVADRLRRQGLTVYRMDMRGCGAAADLAVNVMHAGRSADCLAAMDHVARRHSGKLGVAGFSMGGNQVLRMLGRLGSGDDPSPGWSTRLVAAVALAPPVDLARCSRFMLQGSRRVYSRYFLKQLLASIPRNVASRQDVAETLRNRRPKTLWDLDDRLTAPLSGFVDAEDYYDRSSSMHVTGAIRIPTLLIAAADDPIVPVSCFRGPEAITASGDVHLELVPRGGHLGYVDRRWRCWADEAIEAFFVRSLRP